MSRCYVTCSIPYVNASPHVGYALELVQADTFARSRRNRGDEVRLLGGTDEHALKNVLSAEAAGQPVREFVDAKAAEFAALADPLNISFDDFIRTSADPRHAPGVTRLWKQIAAAGDLYRRRYAGAYCSGCEQFYADVDLILGCCPEHQTPVEHVEEENWFFRLSRYEEQIREAITSGELAIEPEQYRNEVLSFLDAGLEDISVSRREERARGWGIPVPDDPGQVVYVWWEALANYITALGYGTEDANFRRWWLEANERVHFIGKGIVRFHAVYWPALLLSVGLPLPTRLNVHPYLTFDGAKISKSLGNGPDPVALVDAHGVDALRWWLLRDVPRAADTDFTVQRLVERYDADLADGVGNLASRVAGLVARFGADAATNADGTEWPELADLGKTVDALIDNFDFRAAASWILQAVAALNRYVEQTKAWQLAREARNGSVDVADELRRVLVLLVNSVDQIAAVLKSLIPDGATRVGDLLRRPDAARAGGVFPKSEAPALTLRDAV